MPLEIAFVPRGHAEGQAIGDLSRDLLRETGGWMATIMALGAFAERILSNAAELYGSDFNAPATDFDRVHFRILKKEKAA
jgi:hypothetical protein